MQTEPCIDQHVLRRSCMRHMRQAGWGLSHQHRSYRAPRKDCWTRVANVGLSTVGLHAAAAGMRSHQCMSEQMSQLTCTHRCRTRMTAVLPRTSTPLRRSSSMQPSAVQGTNAGAEPRVSRRPTFSGWKPSTSFAGSIACMPSASQILHLDEAASHLDEAASHIHKHDQVLQNVMMCFQSSHMRAGWVPCRKACKMAALVAVPGARASKSDIGAAHMSCTSACQLLLSTS